MDGVAQLNETTLLAQIRRVRSENELSHLIENSYKQVAGYSGESQWNLFSSSLIRQINSINPLYIEDPAEWDILRRARVLIYRQSMQLVP
jgi:hypothetical protein